MFYTLHTAVVAHIKQQCGRLTLVVLGCKNGSMIDFLLLLESWDYGSNDWVCDPQDSLQRPHSLVQ